MSLLKQIYLPLYLLLIAKYNFYYNIDNSERKVQLQMSVFVWLPIIFPVTWFMPHRRAIFQQFERESVKDRGNTKPQFDNLTENVFNILLCHSTTTTMTTMCCQGRCFCQGYLTAGNRCWKIHILLHIRTRNLHYFFLT